MFRKFAIIILSVALMAASAVSTAEDNPVIFSCKSDAAARPLKPGDQFALSVVARIKAGWHLYSTTQQPGGPAATCIMLPPGQPFQLAGAIKSPSPLTDFDENFGIDTQFYEESATFTLPVMVKTDARAGKQRLQVKIFFQTCDDRFCLPPRTIKLERFFEVVDVTRGAKSDEGQRKEQAQQEGKLQAPQPAQQPTPAPTKNRVEHYVAGAENELDRNPSLLSFIWLAVAVGALSLLTPCVFPMVPITVSYFTAHAGASRAAAVRDALVYVAGIIITFTLLGMTLALFVGAAGMNRFAANPWINLLIAAIFLGFALNLFSAYQIQVPSGILTRLDAITRREGGSRRLATFLMGVTFTLTSFTCTSPFVGTLLVVAAQGQWQWPLLGMLIFSTVFALPFFALALVPQLLSRLPRSGRWLHSVKVVMGLIEVAAAIKFISNVDLIWRWGVFTRETVLACWVAVSLLIAVYLLGTYGFTHDSVAARVRRVSLALALLFLVFALHLSRGLWGTKLGEIESFLPPADDRSITARSNAAQGELTWMLNDYEGALAQAKEEKKLVLIDFTGYTCANCRWMEANMFPQEEVRQELDRYVRVRLYTDGEGEIYNKQQQLQESKFGTVALPYYAVVDEEGDTIASFSGLTRNSVEFASFLNRARLSAYRTEDLIE
jgi:thiol:disulfide interchange protein